MESSLEGQEVLLALKCIVGERDALRKELSIAKETITELELQNTEYNRLLTNAHKEISAHDPERSPISPLPKSWIGTWLSSPLDYPTLLPAEEAWQNGHLQRALNMMPAMLAREGLSHHHQINARLLYSAMLQSSGSNLAIALQYAEEALQSAIDYRLYHLAGKARFHQGLCFLHMYEPAKARWCFNLSSHLRDHEKVVEDCRLVAEKDADALREDESNRLADVGIESPGKTDSMSSGDAMMGSVVFL